LETKFTLEPQDNKRLANLCGEHDRNLRQIEKYFKVAISNRGHEFNITGENESVQKAQQAIEQLFNIEKHITPEQINLVIHPPQPSKTVIHTPNLTIKPRTTNQTQYLANINKYDLIFGIGPAGTGKTYLAVAYIDLHKSQMPGLKNAIEILKHEPDIGFNYFSAKDIVRHPLVQRIVEAYERKT
jgi:phosphate starvation-inducible PhoH-like protein